MPHASTPSAHPSRPITRRAFVAGVAGAAVAGTAPLTACRERQAVEPGPLAGGEPFDLPQPEPTGIALDDVLARRRSTRSFSGAPLDEGAVGQLLWAAQGVTSDDGKRTAPSAGARYPIQLFAVTPDRVLHYLPDGHRAEPTIERDVRTELRAAALDQAAIGGASLVVVVTVVPARTAEKYGDRGRRFVDLEAGHVAQNLLLEATALGYGSVPIGSFDDVAVTALLGLPAGYEPRYLVAIGPPREVPSAAPGADVGQVAPALAGVEPVADDPRRR